MGSEPSGVATEKVDISGARFLEYTSKNLASQFISLSQEAKATLLSWPCLCMAEGRGQERAIVGRILAIDASGASTVATVRIVPTIPQLTNDAIWRLRDALDIDQFEFHRHHWALKQRDLVEVLREAGVTFPAGELSAFSRLPLPAPERQDLLRAKQIIGNWNHTEITDLLLEAGVDGLHAPADASRRDRANTILTYIFAHPSATTADGSLLSAYFVRKAGLAPEVITEPAATELERRPLPRASLSADQRSSNRVFVAHGRNTAMRTEVAKLLTEFGLEPVILNEQPNMGRHLLTKFIDEAVLTTFAVVLLTDDDVGSQAGEELSPRARQNVILELGYFIAHLGQHRVCALKTPSVETPSDFDGIAYIPVDDAGGWKEALHRELVAARLPLRSR